MFSDWLSANNAFTEIINFTQAVTSLSQPKCREFRGGRIDYGDAHTLITRIVNMYGGVERIAEGLIISFEGSATKATKSDIILTLAEISRFA